MVTKIRGMKRNSQHNNSRLGIAPQVSTWRRPRQSWSKCNFDASFTSLSLNCKIGWVIRGDQGVSRCRHAKGIKVSSALEAEFIALLIAMRQCWIRGYTKLIFERDNMKMMDILNHKKLHFGMYNWVRKVRWWGKRFLFL